MRVQYKNFEAFSDEMIRNVSKVIERAIAFIYYREIVLKDSYISTRDIIHDFGAAGLPKPIASRLRVALAKDRRTYKPTKDTWRIQKDKIHLIDVQLRPYIEKQKPKSIPLKEPQGNPFDFFTSPIKNNYVDNEVLAKLKSTKNSRYDLSRLVKMCEELNDAFDRKNYISVILLVRAIIDHIPPLLDCKNFNEVENNYGGGKSFKSSMEHLNKSSRNIADTYLHVQVRDQEVIPGINQVNFINDLDVLLNEIVRISKGAIKKS